MSKAASTLLKCLAIGAGVGLATCAIFYGFFVSHQELGIAPPVAYRFAALAFALSAIASLIYFRIKDARQ
jgi:hypothetical protein